MVAVAAVLPETLALAPAMLPDAALAVLLLLTVAAVLPETLALAPAASMAAFLVRTAFLRKSAMALYLSCPWAGLMRAV